METKVEDTMCTVCELIEEKAKNDYVVWSGGKCIDGCQMLECPSCKRIRVWVSSTTRRSYGCVIKKFISNQDPEYIIWKLK